MKKKFTMLLAALFLVMGSAWAQVYQKVPHTQWIVTALNEAGTQGNEGGLAFLKDENPSTFYHSDYSNSYSDGTSGKKKGQDGLQAFMVEMGEVASFDRITYAGRSNGGNNWATKVRIYVFETLPAGWPKDGENNKTLSALTYTEKEELLKRTDNTVLGTPAFDNNEEGAWAADQNLKTAEFATPQTGKYILFVADATSTDNGYFTCSDFHVWQKVEGIVEDKPYFLKITNAKADGEWYLDTHTPIADNQGNTIGRSVNKVATYFTMSDGYWRISTQPHAEGNFVSVQQWNAQPQESVADGWTIEKNSDGTIYLKQHEYWGGGNTARTYLGGDVISNADVVKVYTDNLKEKAIALQLVELNELETAKENARLALSKVGVGYPAVDSEARTTLQTAIDAADATVESINEAIAAYQDKIQTVQMPEVGKVYRLVSGLPGFKTKKAIYSDNIELKWKDKDATAMNQLWVVQSIVGNDITLMNVSDAMFPQKSDFQATVKISTVKNECLLEFLGKGQFQIKANKLQGMHAGSHGNGTGTSGDIINYNTGADGASAWCFEEVAVTQNILNKQIESIENTYISSLLLKQEGVVGLQTAVNEARSNGDYAAALVNLAKAMNAATIEQIDFGYFYLKSKGAEKYAYNENTSLKVTDEKSSPKTIFKLTKANNGTFYIQNGNGLYAQGVNTSQLVGTAISPVEHTITRLSSGYYVLRPTSSTNVQGYWHDANNGTGNIVGWSTDANNTQWIFESLPKEEMEKLYCVKDFYTSNADASVTYNGEYAGDTEVKQAGGFYMLDEAPQSSDFTINNIEKGKVVVNGNSLYVCEGYDATQIYTLRCKKDNSYARYHSGSQLSAEDATNMLTYENNNLHFESLFFIEEGAGDYAGYYTIRSVVAPTMYAYNLKTANENSTVAMKKAPAEGDLTSAYYWTISSFGKETPANITPWGEGGEAYGWNKRGGYNGYNHIGYWQGGNGYEDNKWYVNIVKDELVEKFIPLHTVANSVIGYATYEDVAAVLPYTEVITAEGLNKLKNAQFKVVAPQVGKYYRLKNEASGLYMSGDEEHITLVDKEHVASTIFYLDENYALKAHNTGRYLDCSKKDYAEGDNKPAGTFGFAYGGEKPNVITYNNNNNWTFGGTSNGNLDRGSDNPNQTGYNWILEEGDVDVWEAKAKLVPLIEELYNPWALSFPLQVDDANAGYYLSSCGSADGNVEANMIDGQNNTFYGSPWSYSVDGIDYHYWQVDLGEGVSLKDFVFSYTTRDNGDDTPYSIVVKGSANGTEFYELKSITEGLPQSASASYTSETISNPNNYRYLRFEVTDAKKGNGANPGYAAGGHATQKTFAIAEFVMCHHTKPIMDAAQAVVDNKGATLAEVNLAYQNLKMMNVEKPVYPFTVTNDDENPVLYAIKSGRDNEGKEWWYTYDSNDGKIALSPYAGTGNQFWFFKEVVTVDYQYALQLYPYVDKTKAMSYENTNDGAAKIVAQTPGADGWTNLWLLASTEGNAPYGLQTYDKKNYLSNNGGYTNKMGMWNAAPKDDSGTAMYFSTPAEVLQDLIDAAKVKAISGHDGEVGYYTSETAEALRTAITQAEANLANKSYSVSELNAAIANLSLVLPEAGKYYQIKSANPQFLAKQGKEMAIYSSNDQGQLAWKALDATDKSFYWTITPMDGKFIFMNVFDSKYVPVVSDDAYTMTETESAAAKFTLTWLTPGQFNIKGSGTMHMAGHDEGAGEGGRICSWDGGINSSSAWTIVEVEHPSVAALKIEIDEAVAYIDAIGSEISVGSVSENSRNAILEALDEAKNVLENEVGYDKADEARLKLVDAMGKVETIQPVENAYYYIASAMPNTDARSGQKIYVNANGGMQFHDAATMSEIFQFVDAGNNKFYLYNMERGTYLSTAKAHNGGQELALANSKESAVTVTITNMGRGNVVKIVPEGGAMIHAQASGSSVVAWNNLDNEGASAWQIVEVPTASLVDLTRSVTVNQYGYSTLYLNYPVVVPAIEGDGNGVFVASSVDGSSLYLNKVEAGATLSAKTGVVVKAEANSSCEFKYSAEDGTTESLFTGTLLNEKIYPDGKTICYMLGIAKETGEIGFYPVKLRDEDGNPVGEGGIYFQNSANKIYLPVAKGQNAPSLSFRFGTSEVEHIDAAQETETRIYDLMGRRVEKMDKGLYIVNGKKILVK